MTLRLVAFNILERELKKFLKITAVVEDREDYDYQHNRGTQPRLQHAAEGNSMVRDDFRTLPHQELQQLVSNFKDILLFANGCEWLLIATSGCEQRVVSNCNEWLLTRLGAGFF